MKSIIVTGATSMIGMSLIEEAIYQGTEVFAIARKDSPRLSRLQERDKLHIIYGDMENIEEWQKQLPKGCDVFYHIAWIGTGAGRNKSVRLQSKNIRYTLEAVEAAAKAECRRFVGAGSQAEYGLLDLPAIHPFSPANPTTPYGAAKLAAGNLSRMLCDELGVEWIWPRIFSVYGIYEKENTMISTCLRSMLQGCSPDFTPAEQRWDYLYSKDAGRAYYLIGKYGIGGSYYCVGSGQARPLKEYICEMGSITGTEPDGIGKLPYPEGAVMNLCADIESLYRDTGFVPRYTFEEGIRETIAWMRTSRQMSGGETCNEKETISGNSHV